MTTDQPPFIDARRAPGSLATWALIIYILHGVSIVPAATVIGVLPFAMAMATGGGAAVSAIALLLLSGFSTVAVIMSYVKRSAAQGTWLESHFNWQIRTFWFGLLGVVLGIFLSISIAAATAAAVASLVVVASSLAFVAMWFTYRVVRGAVALSRRRGIG